MEEATAAAEEKKTKKVRLLKKDERSRINKSVAKEQVLAYVLNSVPSKLVSSMFPERKVFWDCYPRKSVT